jgi:hypothetical protein
MPRDAQAKDAPARTFIIEPFDLMLHATETGVQALQTRFANWLRALSGPARFVCWQIPATLDEKIASVSRAARETDNPQRARLLMEYRRYYELLQESAEYQRALCGMAVWSDENPRALAAGMGSAFDTPVAEAAWPALFEGHCTLRDTTLLVCFLGRRTRAVLPSSETYTAVTPRLTTKCAVSRYKRRRPATGGASPVRWMSAPSRVLPSVNNQ